MMFMGSNTPSTKYYIDWGNGQPLDSNLSSSTYYSSIYTIPGYYNINLYMIDTITGCSSNISQDLFWGGSNPGGGITPAGATTLSLLLLKLMDSQHHL